MKVWIPHPNGRELIGRLPDEVTLEIAERPDELPSDPADLVFWVPPFLAQSDSVRLAAQMPALRVVQLLSAGADAWYGHLPAAATLHDARGVHDSSTAEWVLTAILSYLREFPGFARAQARHEWSYSAYAPTDELAGKHVLIVGAGSIGTAIECPAGAVRGVGDVGRAHRPPDGVHAVSELPALLPAADVVVVIVPLTAETRGLVDGRLPGRDEGRRAAGQRRPRPGRRHRPPCSPPLATGRIGAAVDVTEPEPLPADHPLWDLPNVLITPHVAGSVRGLLPAGVPAGG